MIFKCLPTQIKPSYDSTKIFQSRLYKCVPLHNSRLHSMSSYPFQAYSRNASKNWRVSSVTKAHSNCEAASMYGVHLGPQLGMGHCTVCRSTLMIWSFIILGGSDGFFKIPGQFPRKAQPTKSCLPDIPLASETQQYSPVSAFIGSGHGLVGSGANL